MSRLAQGSFPSENLCNLFLFPAPSPTEGRLPLPPACNRTKRKESEPASEKRPHFRVYSIYIYEGATKCQALLLGVAIGIMKQT